MSGAFAITPRRRFTMTPVSRFKAKVDDGVIRETQNRRLIFRPETVDNQNDPAASVHGRLIYQRRHSKNSPWEDEPAFNLSNMKGGEQVQLNLDAEATRRLYLELDQRYRLPIDWNVGESREFELVDRDECYVATGKEGELIERLIDQEGDQFWEYVEQLAPEMVTSVGLRKMHQERSLRLTEFEQHVEDNDWSETDWHNFFKTNTWIFGHNLLFQFLTTLEERAHVGGTTLSGAGGQEMDFLLHTEATARFTVLVDIKKPNTELVGMRPYRNKVYPLGSDLTGGVSKLQSYCRTWIREGAEQESTAEYLRENRIFTYEPRAILVIGHCRQLDNQDKRATFELCRRNLHNPEILTFDELLDRTRFTVESVVAPTIRPGIPTKYQD